MLNGISIEIKADSVTFIVKRSSDPLSLNRMRESLKNQNFAKEETIPVLASNILRKSAVWSIPRTRSKALTGSCGSHKIQERFLDRRQSAENAVSGDDEYYEKVDRSTAGLEPHPCAAVHLFRWAYAGLTPAAEECQGYMNGFAALDFPPCQRYVVVKATAGFAVCRLILKLLLFYSCLDFTQNLGKTPELVI